MQRSNWFEDDVFWETIEGFLFSQFRSSDFTTREADQILALVGLPQGAAVLDLCCGPGRHVLEFARRGFRVTGVDRTQRYLEAARATALSEGLTVELVQADMRDFSRPPTFDLALNLFSSFGYFAEAADDLQVLRNLNASLAPGGTVLLEMLGKEVLAQGFETRTWHRYAERDEFLLEERTVHDGWGTIENHWIWIRGSDRKEFDWSIRLYSGAELRGLLFESGFSTVQLYGSLAGIPYDEDAERLVAIATR